jgi:hypothetical protein
MHKRVRIAFDLKDRHAQAVEEMFCHFHRKFPRDYPTRDDMLRQLLEDLIDDYSATGGWESAAVVFN